MAPACGAGNGLLGRAPATQEVQPSVDAFGMAASGANLETGISAAARKASRLTRDIGCSSRHDDPQRLSRSEAAR
jgi:hypothetical protein